MEEEKKDELLIRIDERVEHLIGKVDKLVDGQPLQDAKITKNSTSIFYIKWIVGILLVAIIGVIARVVVIAMVG